MAGDQFLFGDLQLLQKLACYTRIFTYNGITILECFDGSQGDVSEVANRCRDDGKHSDRHSKG